MDRSVAPTTLSQSWTPQGGTSFATAAVDITDLSRSAGASLPAPQLAAVSLGADGRRGIARSLGQYGSLPLDSYEAQKIFHPINTSQPRLQLIHESPYIFVVPDFLTQGDCAKLIALHSTAETRGPSATSSEQSEVRTSTTVLPPSEDGLVREVRERIAKLANVATEQLDSTKITRYARGQFFRPHIDTDTRAYGDFKSNHLLKLVSMGQDTAEAQAQFDAAFDGPTSVFSCPDRFCSVFIYLNDVHNGGQTTFSKVQNLTVRKGVRTAAAAVDSLRGKSHPKGAPIAESELDCLHIKPRAGMACIHFPTTVAEYGCLRDVSTSHESEEAISPKFIVQQFIWARPIDEAKAAINAHTREYQAVALDGERERGKGGVVLVEAGRPSRYVTAEDLTALPSAAHPVVRHLMQRLAREKNLGEIVVLEVDDRGGLNMFQVASEVDADGWQGMTRQVEKVPC